MTLDYNISDKMVISILLIFFSINLYAQDTNKALSNTNTLVITASSYLEEADLSFRRRDYRSAIEFYEKVLDISPVVEIDYFVNLARSYIALGDYNQAIVATRRGIRFNSVISWDIYYQKGYAFYKLGDYKNAILSVERALTIHESAYLYNFIGLMYIYSEDYPNAQEKFLSAITYSPNNPTFLCNLAASYEMQRNFNEALNIYERALQFDPEGRTHARREATRIRNYLETRNSLPREVDDNNIGSITSSTNSDVGIIEDNTNSNETSITEDETLETTE